jgi:quercetin dioxygenase-like cupin family protein
MEARDPRTVQIGELQLTFLVNDPGATVFEFVIPTGARVPVPHYHRDADETIYGLEGTADVSVDGKVTRLGVGEAVFIPRGAVHFHANPHEGRSRTLVVLTPGSIARRYFEEIAEVVNAPGKPDLAKMKEIMQHHGLVPA